MMPVDQTIDQQQVPYISAFEHSETDLARIGHPWIHQIRRDAIDCALAELVEGPAPTGPSTV